MPVKAILLDYDDTLVDTFGSRLLAAKLAAEGILDPALDMNAIMRNSAGRPQRDIWKDLSDSDQTAEILMEKYMNHYWNDTSKSIEIFQGVKDLLSELMLKQLKLGIVTSKVRLMHNATGPYGVLVEIKRLGLSEMFDVVVGWPDVAESKPHPAPIHYALNQLKISPDDAVMVGDSHIDIKAAKRAGVTSVAAKWGTLNEHLLIQSNPDYTIESPHQLIELV